MAPSSRPSRLASCFGIAARHARNRRIAAGLGWLANTVVDTAFEPENDANLRRLMSVPETLLGLGIPAGTALAIRGDGGRRSPARQRGRIPQGSGPLVAQLGSLRRLTISTLATENESGQVLTIEELTRLFSVLSHDLKSPIFSIDGFSDLLLSDYNDKLDEEGQDFLRRIRSSAQQMKRVLDEMSHLVKLLALPNVRRHATAGDRRRGHPQVQLSDRRGRGDVTIRTNCRPSTWTRRRCAKRSAPSRQRALLQRPAEGRTDDHHRLRRRSGWLSALYTRQRIGIDPRYTNQISSSD